MVRVFFFFSNSYKNTMNLPDFIVGSFEQHMSFQRQVEHKNEPARLGFLIFPIQIWTLDKLSFHTEFDFNVGLLVNCSQITFCSDSEFSKRAAKLSPWRQIQLGLSVFLRNEMFRQWFNFFS